MLIIKLIISHKLVNDKEKLAKSSHNCGIFCNFCENLERCAIIEQHDKRYRGGLIMKTPKMRYRCLNTLIAKVMPTHEKVHVYKGAVLWLRRRVQGGYLMRIHMSTSMYRDIIVSDDDHKRRLRMLENVIDNGALLEEFEDNLASGTFRQG